MSGDNVTVEQLDTALQALAVAVEMRIAQKRYFKERNRERLIESKQVEAKFDKLIAKLAVLRKMDK
jgi:hypothetical protein